MRRILLVWMIGAVAAFADDTNLAPQQIVERMAKTYGECGTYQDEGMITFISNRGATTRTNDRPFRILCDRFGGTNGPSTRMFPSPPKFLRFDFSLKTATSTSETKYVLWVVNGRVRSCWEALGNETYVYPDVRVGVLAAAGTSGSCVPHSVPELLIDSREGQFLAQVAGVSLTGGETVDGQDCYVITGQTSRPATFERPRAMASPFRWWIGKNDYLLRKQQCSVISSNGDSYISVEVHRNIKLNEPIPQSAFEFVPPTRPSGAQPPAP